MHTIKLILQTVIALGIINVWLLRFGSPSAWRGASAANMREEFAAYGLPGGAIYLVGFLQPLRVSGVECHVPASKRPAT